MRDWWRVFQRTPSPSAVLSAFSQSLAPDSDRREIARSLEMLLCRALRRNVVVSLGGALREAGGVSSERSDPTWCTDPRSIALELQAMAREGEGRSPKEWAGDPRQVAALVWIHSSEGSRDAIVVIGRRWMMPLSGRDRLLVAASIGMASLLFEHNRLRQDLRLAEAQAKTLGRLVKSRRQAAWTSRN